MFKSLVQMLLLMRIHVLMDMIMMETHLLIPKTLLWIFLTPPIAKMAIVKCHSTV